MPKLETSCIRERILALAKVEATLTKLPTFRICQQFQKITLKLFKMLVRVSLAQTKFRNIVTLMDVISEIWKLLLNNNSNKMEVTYESIGNQSYIPNFDHLNKSLKIKKDLEYLSGKLSKIPSDSINISINQCILC